MYWRGRQGVLLCVLLKVSDVLGSDQNHNRWKQNSTGAVRYSNGKKLSINSAAETDRQTDTTIS